MAIRPEPGILSPSHAVVPEALNQLLVQIIAALNNGAAGVSSVGATAPISSSGGSTPIIALLPFTASPAFSATPTIVPLDVIYFGALTANVTAFNFDLTGTKWPRVQVWFTQDATGGRTVVAGTSIEFGTDIPNLTGIASGANASTLVGFNYNPITGKYRVVAIVK